MLTSGVTLLLACGAFVAVEVTLFRREMVNNLTTRARVLAANTSGALAFENPADAREVLAALRADPRAVAAALYDQHGKIFATYPDSFPPAYFPDQPEREGHRFTETHLLVFHPVRQGDRQLGTIFIKSNLSALRERLQLFGGIALAVIGGATMIAFALASWLQARISRPIITLADSARTVTERKDYSVRAPALGDDELGQLTESFNSMLAQIQERDASLRGSEERFRSLVTASSQIVWTADAQGQVKGPLPSWRAYTGQSDVEGGAPDWAAAIHPEDARRALEAWKQAVRDKTVYDAEYRIRRGDGIFRYFVARGVPVMNEDGSIREWVGTCTDIHDRKMAEEALRESEARKAAMLETALDCIITMDHEGRVVEWNPAAERTFGYSRDQALGEPLAQLIIPAALREEHPLGLAHLLSAGSGAILGKHLELPVVRSGGVEFPAEMAISAIAVRNHKMFTAYLRDITERKRAEAEIQKLNAELEQRVLERTAQLEAANKELEAFSYSVSHDLRAPLRGILGFARMLLEDCSAQLDAEGRRLLKVVSAEAGRMGRLIDDLLEFSRLGRQPMAAAEVNMTELARTTFASLLVGGLANTPELRLMALPAARGDRSMLRQVFANLLGNAIKFSSRNPHPVIEVSGHPNSYEDIYHVKDNGVGFDTQYKAKLFRVFQRLHSETEFEGTGVGLALVHRVILRHGGRVWAEAELDKGASFYFSLPKRKEVTYDN